MMIKCSEQKFSSRKVASTSRCNLFMTKVGQIIDINYSPPFGILMIDPTVKQAQEVPFIITFFCILFVSVGIRRMLILLLSYDNTKLDVYGRRIIKVDGQMLINISHPSRPAASLLFRVFFMIIWTIKRS